VNEPAREVSRAPVGIRFGRPGDLGGSVDVGASATPNLVAVRRVEGGAVFGIGSGSSGDHEWPI